MYSKRLIYDYIIGNDIVNIEQLESDNVFLFEVLKESKDISYYKYLDDDYRRSYQVIKYMLLNFKDKLDIYKKDLDYLLKVLDKESVEYKEIVILVSLIDKDIFNNYKIRREGIYALDKIEIGAIKNSDDALNKEIGFGFEVILSKYEGNLIILDYYAKSFLYEIFYQDKNFEKLIHKNTKNKDKINRVGNIRYLLDYIGNLDFYLKEYLQSHLYLLDNLSKDLDLVKTNWENYMNRLNDRKVAIVYQEVNRFAEEQRGKFFFDCYAVLEEIIFKYNLEEIFGLEEKEENVDLVMNEYLKKQFIYNITKLIKELFKEDIIASDNSDYDINKGEIVQYKKRNRTV